MYVLMIRWGDGQVSQTYFDTPELAMEGRRSIDECIAIGSGGYYWAVIMQVERPVLPYLYPPDTMTDGTPLPELMPTTISEVEQNVVADVRGARRGRKG